MKIDWRIVGIALVMILSLGATRRYATLREVGELELRIEVLENALAFKIDKAGGLSANAKRPKNTAYRWLAGLTQVRARATETQLMTLLGKPSRIKQHAQISSGDGYAIRVGVYRWQTWYYDLGGGIGQLDVKDGILKGQPHFSRYTTMNDWITSR